MADSETLTIRLDEQLKQRLQRLAVAEDRSVSEYVIRSIKERMDVQCEACGRSSGASVLPYGLSPAFENWLKETRGAQHSNPFYVTTIEGGQRVVYWCCHRRDMDPVGALLVYLIVQYVPRELKYRASIPLGVITGVGLETNDGDEYGRLRSIGYLDGNEQARRILLARELGLSLD